MKIYFLAIAAHPDDVELTCGGTLLKMAQAGHRTGILDLTRGEMGTRGTPEQRAKEAAKAARVLRAAHRENLGLPDAHLAVTDELSASSPNESAPSVRTASSCPTGKAAIPITTTRHAWPTKGSSSPA